ncbi:MAG TPA: YfbU family protein [Nitratidesulfovibrio sp.]|nr:YfbU family protein [Nitratidesulfovibrio sp.]
MKLSKIERQILVNQFTILEQLIPNEQEHYRRCKEVFQNGYTLDYERHMSVSDETDEYTCRFVRRALSMFDDIQRVFGRDEALAEREPGALFNGFDGNNEPAHLGYLRFFCGDESMPRYTDLRCTSPRDWNSHMPTLDVYARMLRVYDKYANEYGAPDLTQEQAREIIAARIHPDSR